MSALPKPDTQEEMLYQLWYAIIGSNGDGLASIVKGNSTDIAEIKAVIPSLWTKEEHCAAETEDDTKRERRKFSGREKWLIVATALSPIIAVVLAHYVR